jgi:hypothetical protein
MLVQHTPRDLAVLTARQVLGGDLDVLREGVFAEIQHVRGPERDAVGIEEGLVLEKSKRVNRRRCKGHEVRGLTAANMPSIHGRSFLAQ